MLGQNVSVRVSSDVAAIPIEKPSTSYIWPVCLPKDDDDDGFTPSPVIQIEIPIVDTDYGPEYGYDPYPDAALPTHPHDKNNTVNAMLAGWLDAPPISQAFSNLLGSSLKEADVLK